MAVRVGSVENGAKSLRQQHNSLAAAFHRLHSRAIFALLPAPIDR
ncbi:hypothetical protein [Mycolicibacterium tokaiense]|nr:hypothetical protein [Mycolicibacterium tokaiense]